MKKSLWADILNPYPADFIGLTKDFYLNFT